VAVTALVVDRSVFKECSDAEVRRAEALGVMSDMPEKYKQALKGKDFEASHWLHGLDAIKQS
jgi:hypothetical protein